MRQVKSEDRGTAAVAPTKQDDSSMKKEIGTIERINELAPQQLNFGFIKHPVLGDVFFHHSQIEADQKKSDFQKNAIVLFETRPSKKHPGKIDAINVKLASTELDFTILLTCLFSTFAAAYGYKQVQITVAELLENILSSAPSEEFRVQAYSTFRQLLSEYIAETKDDYRAITNALIASKRIFPSHYEIICHNVVESIEAQTAHRLWLDNLVDSCQVSIIADLILSKDKVSAQRAIDKAAPPDRNIIFSKVVELVNAKTDEISLDDHVAIFSLCNKYADNHQKFIIKPLFDNLPTHEKISLWLCATHEYLNFDEYKNYIHLLDSADQVKFIKKVFSYIHQGNVKLTAQDITSIYSIRSEASRQEDASQKHCLDYSSIIIINVIDILSRRVSITETGLRNRIFNIIIDQLRNPGDILMVRDYFDRCRGRSLARPSGDHEDSELEIYRPKQEILKFHEICDGRQAKSPDGSPILDRKYSLPFWWCANSPCFKIARGEHAHNEWQHYSLYDFLKILRIDFNDDDFEIFLNVINKANIFLKHLKCKSCGHILRPKNKSNYAFYGVNNFICINDSCDESTNQTPVYLTHCMNDRCRNVIDSRETSKCENGWYICTYCFACCADKTSNDRVKTRKLMQQDPFDRDKGNHRELRVICCHLCGNSLENMHKQYFTALEWFSRNSEIGHKNIGKYGIGKNNRAWFIFKRDGMSKVDFRNRIMKLVQLGFNIPDADDERKDSQLVSEPIERITSYICKTCNATYDISSDKDRLNVIKHFHLFLDFSYHEE